MTTTEATAQRGTLPADVGADLTLNTDAFPGGGGYKYDRSSPGPIVREMGQHLGYDSALFSAVVAASKHNRTVKAR